MMIIQDKETILLKIKALYCLIKIIDLIQCLYKILKFNYLE
jgi:hypothetical protein